MTIIARCSKGAMIQEFQGGHQLFKAEVGLTDINHYGTLAEMQNCFCNAVCSDVQQKACSLLDKHS